MTNLIQSFRQRSERLRQSRRRQARNRGTVTLIVGLSLTMIFGFAALAVDFGLQVADKNRLQRGCDAAALAGAVELKKTGNDTNDMAKARVVAVAVAQENGVTVDSNAITFLDSNTKIRVPALNTRTTLFARIFNISTTATNAVSLAKILPVSEAATPRVVPIGITKLTYDTYKNDTLVHTVTLPRPVDTIYTLDNFLLFDLRPSNAKSGPHMQSQLIGEEFQDVKIGTMQTSLNASAKVVGSNFEPALSTIFQRSAQAPWNDTWTGNLMTSTGIRYDEILAGTAVYDNPRVMNIIVNPEGGTPTGGGTWDVQIIDFAPVYIESYQRSVDATGNTLYQMNIRFLPRAFVSGGDVIGDVNGMCGGVCTVTLVG